MIDFCTRHDIVTVTEEFALADANNAIDRREHGKPRYRVVLNRSAERVLSAAEATQLNRRLTLLFKPSTA